MTAFAKALFVGAIVLTFLGSTAWSQLPSPAAGAASAVAKPATAEVTRPDSYFRLIVPEERLDDISDLRIPMKRTEFNKRLALLNGAQAKNSLTRYPRILSGEYQARYDGRQLSGEAYLEIVRDADASAFLPLSPVNFAVTSALWEDETPRAASLGLAPSGEIGVLVETSGRLKLAWTLSSNSVDKSSFALRLPEALVNELDVKTSPNYRLTATGAYVTEQPAADKDNTVDSGISESREWHVLLGGKSQTTISFESNSKPQPSKPRVVWREQAEYDISPSSIECLATWHLDVTRTPQTELVLQGDAAASLAEIRVGNQSLTWSIQNKPTGWTAVVTLPDPIFGPARPVVVRTVSTAKLGQKQTLPRVRLEGSEWHGSDVTVRINDSLRMEDVNLTTGRIVFANWEAPGSQEVRLQAFAENYQAEVIVNRRASRPTLTTATLVQIDAVQMNAVVQGEMSADDPRFVLQAILPRAWVIDSVDTIPADLLEDRVITGINDGAQRVDIHLRRAASVDRPLRFVIRAHRRRPPSGESIPCKSLRVLEVPSADAEKIIAVDVLDPSAQLQFSGDARLERLAEADLSEVERELLPSPGVLLFRDDEQATELELRLEARRPRFVATPNVQVTVEPDRLDYLLAVRCTPEGTPPRKLLVRLAAASSQTIEWQGSESLGEVTARPVAGTSDEPGENWLVEWSRLPVGPFEITARFSRSMEEQQRLPLMSLPEATSQRGVVEILSAHAGLFALESAGAQPLPTTSSGEGTARVRARLRYEPASRESVVLRSLPATMALPAARCDSAQLTSRVGMEGSALHELRLSVVNEGGGVLRFRLPGGKLLQSLVDGRELEVEEGTDQSGGWYSAQLPDEHRQLQVELTYNTPAQSGRLRPFAHWEFPLPELELPVARREWRMWVPPGLQLISWPANSVNELPGEKITQYQEAGTQGGWSLRALNWPTTGAAVVAVARPTGIAALTFGILFLVVGLMFACGIAGRGWTIPLLLVFAGATYFVPPDWEWLFRGVVWGVLAAFLLVAVRALRLGRMTGRPETAAEAPTTILPLASSIGRSGAILGIAIIIGLACGWWPSFAQETPMAMPEKNVPAPPPVAAGLPDNKPLFLVVDPVDEQGQAKGDYVFVSPEFAGRLAGDLDAASGEDVAWLLQAAEYRAIFLATTGPAEDCRLDAIEAQWEFTVLKPGTRIKLPLNSAQFELIGTGQLDGGEVPIDWQPDAATMSFVVPSAGRHHLRLQFRPHVEDTPTGRRAVVNIPNAATARLTFDSSALVPEINCAAGAFRMTRRQGEAENGYPFGPADRLEFTWRTAAVEPPSLIVGEQLAWWRLRPNGITVETQLRLRPAQGKLSSFVVEADPRLRPLAPEGGLKVQSIASNDLKQTWKFDLPQATEREVVVPVTFQLMGVTPIGRFSPPRLMLQTDRLDRAWSAVSVSTDLQLQRSEPTEETSSTLLAGTEFLAAWRDSTAAVPEAAFPAVEADSWSVDVRPVPQLPRVSERIQLSVAREHQRLRYEAQIEDAENSFLQRLKIPANLQLNSVAVRQEGEVVPSEWKIQKKGTLTLMVARPSVPGERTIVLEGTLPPLADGDLPYVRLAEANVTHCEYQLFEGENLEFKAETAAGWEVDSSARGEFVADWGRRIATWTAAGNIADAAPGKGKVLAHESQVNGDLQIEVVREMDGWFANVRLKFDVVSGTLDHLRLEFPREWTPAAEADSQLTLEIREIPGQLRQQVLLRPEHPWEGSQTVVLRGPLATGTDGFRAPDVRMLERTEWPRTLVLPQRFDKQSIQWSVSGLAELLPANSAANSPPPSEVRYAVPGPRFIAVVDNIQRAAEEPKVLLAAAHVWPRSEGRALGLVEFELIPNGRSTCLLYVPDDAKLAQVTVNGQGAVCRLRQGGTWEVALESAELPQLVGASFECQTSEQAGLPHITLPMLVGVPVERTMWLIHQAKSSSVAVTEKQDVPREAALLLLETQTQALQIGAKSDFATKWPEFTAHWLQQRKDRWQTLQEEWQVVLGGDHSPEFAELNEQMLAAEKLFPAIPPVAAERLAGSDEQHALDYHSADQVLLFEKWMGKQSLPVASQKISSSSGAGLWGALLLIVAGALAVILHRYRWEPMLTAHPNWLLAIAGAVAVCALSPAWIGMGLLAFAAAAEIIQRRPLRRRRTATATTVLPRQSTIIPK